MYGARVSRLLHSPRYKKLRTLLAKARREATLTQADVSERLQRPQSFVSKYESGERHLDVLEFIDVCKALGISPLDVMSHLTK